MIGFDAGEDQLEALENEELDGLIVQNPFGMGYAAVVAAARTVLQEGNEAQVDTGLCGLTGKIWRMKISRQCSISRRGSF